MPPKKGWQLQNFVILTALTLGLLGAPGAAQVPGMDPSDPLGIARVLAARYPADPIMSYIPALSWSGAFRLAALTGEDRWRDKPRAQMESFLSGKTPAIAEPYRLTSLAGHLAFGDAAALDGNPEAAAMVNRAAKFILNEPDTTFRFATRWTDDMFMVSAVWGRADTGGYAGPMRQMLATYANKLQRPDGLFNHAADGPHAWGRGNGFALLGLAEGLSYLPAASDAHAWILSIYRRHVRALATHQSDDGSWRQVVDEPTSYRELTVTAMTVAAMSRGVARGWIDRATYQPIIDRGWKAVAARVMEDGTVRDVCSGTGAGPTKEYYLNRPVVNGADDRGGAMALLAAIEIETLRRSR